jgi:hypothetical protein
VPRDECLKVVGDAMRIGRRGGGRGQTFPRAFRAGSIEICRAASRDSKGVKIFQSIDLETALIDRGKDAKFSAFATLGSQKLIGRYVSGMNPSMTPVRRGPLKTTIVDRGTISPELGHSF